MTTLLSAISKHGQVMPDAVAIRTGNSILSYSDLNRKLNTMAEQLQSQNIKLLALYADNSPTWVIIDLACQKAGICLLPIPTFFSAQQINHSLQTSGADALIAALPISDNAELQRLTLSLDDNLNFYKLLSNKSVRLPEGTAKITFTSGSTGNPKGVCLSNQQMLNVAQSIVFTSPAEKIIKHLCVLPLAVLLENIGGVYSSLLIGSTIILLAPEKVGFTGSSLFKADVLLNTLIQYRPNSLILLPQLLTSLIALFDRGLVKPAEELNYLKFIAVGGGKVAVSHLLKAKKYGFPVFEGYGLTECASVVCMNNEQQQLPGSVGKFLPHISAEIAADGELIINGQTFLGYLNEPASWYPEFLATGDLCQSDQDGFISISGRKKNLLISSFGRNISPEWIESTLQQAASVEQCIVFGDAKPFCVALIRATSDSISQSQIVLELEEYNQKLPDYARIRNWYFLRDSLTFEEGYLTANSRPKRERIAAVFSSEINALYEEFYAVF